MFVCWWERSTEKAGSQEPHLGWQEPSTSPSGLWLHIPAHLLDLTTWCSCAGVLQAPSSALVSPCPPPPDLHSFKCLSTLTSLSPLQTRNADAKISTECPQAPTLTQPQALLPPLSHICLLNRRGLPVKVLHSLHILPPSLTHYQPNWLMRSNTSTKISKIWITLTEIHGFCYIHCSQRKFLQLLYFQHVS